MAIVYRLAMLETRQLQGKSQTKKDETGLQRWLNGISYDIYMSNHIIVMF